ncbi:hypothetical protein IGI73_003076 [Enterococcus sp. DIV0755f]
MCDKIGTQLSCYIPENMLFYRIHLSIFLPLIFSWGIHSSKDSTFTPTSSIYLFLLLYDKVNYFSNPLKIKGQYSGNPLDL